MRRWLGKTIVKTPWLGDRYLRGILKHLEETPKSKLSPEMQQMKAGLERLPKKQRLPMLKDAMLGNIPQTPEEMPSRALRRQAARSQRRR
jgi:hypothetical protein